MSARLKKAVFGAVAVLCIVSGLYVVIDRINTFAHGFEILFDGESGTARVSDIEAGSAAEEAGLSEGDVVVSFNGQELTSEEECINCIRSSHILGSIELVIRTDAGDRPLVIEGRQQPLSLPGMMLFAIGAVYIVLGCWVFFSRPQYRAANAWGFFSLLMGTVIFSGGVSIGTEHLLTLVFKSVILFSLIISAAALLVFALVFPHPRGFALRRWTMPTIYGVSGLIVLLLFTYLWANMLRGVLTPLVEFLSPLLSVSIAFIWIGYLGLAVVVLLATYMRTGELEEKRRIRWITLGIAIPLGLIVILSFAEYIPGLGGLVPHWTLPILLAAIPLTNFYAIVRYRAMQMELILRRGLVYTLVTGAVLVATGFVFAAVFALLFIIQDLLPQTGNEQNSIVRFLFDPNVQRIAIAAWALLIGVALGRLKRRAQDFVDRRFYRQKYDYRQALRELASVLDRAADRQNMLRIVIDNAERMVHPRSVAVALIADGGVAGVECATPKALLGTTLESAAVEDLKRAFGGGRKFLGLREMSEERSAGNGRVRDSFVRLGADICLPVRSQGRIVGFLFLGPKLSEQEYNLEDIGLLDLLADQTAHGLEHQRLAAEAVEKERIQRELQIGREIQQSLLPATPPRLKGASIAAMSLPAMEVGGDFYTFIEYGSKRLGVIVGDIVGKGVAGAINMAATISSVRLIAEESTSVSETMQRLNRYLVRNSSARSFAAVMFAVIDIEDKKIRWSNAGLPEPILIPAKGNARFLEMESYPLPPGASSRSAYVEAEAELNNGDTMVFVTDGVIEIRPADGSRSDLGYDGLLGLLSVGGRRDPKQVLDSLESSLRKHRGEEVFEDDITAVALHINGGK